jgi:GNAT superfamily N-acetyltransferase
MTQIEVHTGAEPALEAYLAERIYEYNAAATGYRDGETFTAAHRSDDGEVDAGTCGYTWGGCCYVTYLWVAEALRGRGMGGALLDAVERHARAKGCRVMLLTTHSFQAPTFYARKGYEPVARIADHPPGHASFFFVKHLDAR